MNNFLMFVGLPGTGKTTFIGNHDNAITHTYGVNCVISSDAVIEDIAVARGLTYSEVFQDSISLAGKYIDAMLGILSLQQRNFILDQTSLTPKTRQRKLGLLVHPENYNKVAVVFDDITPEERFKRLQERGDATGKHIPTHVIESMAKSFIYPTVEEGFDKVLTVEQFKATLVNPPKPEQLFDTGVSFG